MSTPSEFTNPIADILTGVEQPPDWLIPRMMIQGGFETLVGESGHGKSYLSYTAAMAIAAGEPALSGLIPRGEPKLVIYFDDENSLQDRNKYLRRAYNGLTRLNKRPPDVKILEQMFWPISFHLGDDAWQDTVEEWAVEKSPNCVFFDTANACFNLPEENSNSDARRAIMNIKRLMRLTDPAWTAVVLLHAKTHMEKGQPRTVRGAKVWKDQSDGMMFMIRASGRPRKDGLSLTRLVPDKTRAYGLERTIYITPGWTDADRSGLVLEGTYKAPREHKAAEDRDE